MNKGLWVFSHVSPKNLVHVTFERPGGGLLLLLWAILINHQNCCLALHHSLPGKKGKKESEERVDETSLYGHFCNNILECAIVST